MRARALAVPLRLWLALALVAIVVAPTLVTWGFGQALNGWQQQAKKARWAAVNAAVGDDVARWHEPVWQRQAATAFATLGVEAGLIDKRPRRGGLAFATAGGRRLMDDLGLSPSNVLGRKPVPHAGALAAGAATHGAASSASLADALNSFREIPVLSPTTTAGRTRVEGVADLWFVRPLPPPPPPWIAPAGGPAALLVTLCVVAIFLNRAVLRPLTAMSRAARLVATGTLDLRLPSSAAREVAEVTAALETMSAGLRDAVRRQVDLEQERRLFIGAVAHDLRTPLFTLSSYLSGLRDGVAATPEKAAHYLAVCQEQTAHLERLVADLFAFATVEYLEQEPQCAPLELGAVLRRAIESLQPRATAHGITLSVMEPSVSCPLMGDAQLLIRVVENLLDNALRYTPSGGRVEVRWGHDAQQRAVFFAVTDTGPGLAAQDLPHLFTPLYRGEASRNRQTGGAGLGLAVARRIMQAHGGDLTAGNSAAGGAVLTGRLPANRGAHVATTIEAACD